MLTVTQSKAERQAVRSRMTNTADRKGTQGTLKARTPDVTKISKETKRTIVALRQNRRRYIWDWIGHQPVNARQGAADWRNDAACRAAI